MARLIILLTSIVLMLSTVSCIEKPIQSVGTGFQSPTISNSSSILIRYSFTANKNKILIFIRDDNFKKDYEISLNFEFKKLVEQYHSSLQKFSLPKQKNHKNFIKKSHKLYSILIDPVSELIKGKESLIIDAKGCLQLIPFETLVKNDEIKPFEKTDFLVKDFDIKYLSKKTERLIEFNKSTYYTNAFLGFAPGFEKAPNTNSVLAQNLRNDLTEPLPFSKHEVTQINQLLELSSQQKTQLLLNKQANKQNLKIHLSRNYKYVHIASHGFSDFASERRPGILCGVKNGITQILEVDEISSMNINSDLVVLSVCESGLGKFENRNMRGLHTGFLNAGASNVVYSLWKVNDKRTSELMEEFYSGFLKNKNSYSKALRNAKLKLLANPATSSPNIWAPFVLTGQQFIQFFE